MNATCACQHCSNLLEFESQRAGQVAECPSCGMETMLFIPPSAEAIRVAQYRAEHPELFVKESRSKNLGGFMSIPGCYLLAVFLPLFGFFAGIWLMTKKESGHGCAVMAASVFCGLIWLSLFSSF